MGLISPLDMKCVGVKTEKKGYDEMDGLGNISFEPYSLYLQNGYPNQKAQSIRLPLPGLHPLPPTPKEQSKP